MATFGVDNFVGELTLDGTTANFHFVDPDDIKNVADVSISEKEFPNGVLDASSREVSDYAYSLVAEKMNAVRSERVKATEVQQAADEQDRVTAERATTAAHFKDSQDASVASAGTEQREDGVKQTVYNTGDADAPSVKASDKKK